MVFLHLQTDRLKQVQDHLCALNSLCLVLGMDFKQTISEVHPSLGDSEGSKNISNATIELLVAAIQRLRGVKIQRMQRVKLLYISCFLSVQFNSFLAYLGTLCTLAATRSCNYDAGAVELDGYTNRRATDVSECYS